MKILYAGKNINHHQVPFIKSLMDIVGVENVKYSSIKMIELERLEMGFDQYEGDWLIDSINQTDIFKQWWEQSDIVITNNREYYHLIEERLRKGKMVFLTSERWFKEPEGLLRLFHPHILKLVIKYRQLSKYHDFYYLPQGYFSYNDIARFGILENRAFAFGYLTPLCSNLISRTKVLDHNRINIIWAGSLIRLKRVDLLAKAFCRIHQKYPNTYLTIIGQGPEKKHINSILNNGDPTGSYRIMNFVSNSELRSIMNAADIYVFPSNGAEGWGAVVNEAMSEACAVILSSKVGAISMIKDGYNGLIFQDGNEKSLCESLLRICGNSEYLRTLKNNAKKTIVDEWNPDTAAKRFIDICTNLKSNRKYEITGVELLKRI